MTRVTVTSNENETIAAGEELAQEISKIIADSPTYNIVEIHETDKYKVFHFDLYRITEPIELEEIGIEEYLKELKSVSIFEWPKNGKGTLPSADFNVQISYKDNGKDDRRELLIS
jgi:tRNA threonylcarbamoyl adenosine modification protein YjeE